MTSTDQLLAHCLEHMTETDAANLVPRFQKALMRYRMAPPVLYSIAGMCRQYGYEALWRYYEDLALSLEHVSHEDRYFRGQAMVQHGDWVGWADREARLFSPYEAAIWQPHFRLMQWTTRAWDGKEFIGDKTLYAIADGGFGDCLQMLRYIPTLQARAASVIIGVRDDLASLVHYNFGGRVTVTDIDAPPAESYQRYVWMMSLPALVGSIPPFEKLRVPKPRVINESDPTVRRIGLCWAGHSLYPGDRPDEAHSITLDDLAQLFVLENIEWHSLQVGRWASDADRYPLIVQPERRLESFVDSANLIAGLDCVVTIDTSVAHLAGNLGVPTFLLLGWVPPWRWGSCGDTTPWYPSMRLVRQRVPGDWTDVVGRLLKQLIDSHAESQGKSVVGNTSA
jgi:hypothetical protein